MLLLPLLLLLLRLRRQVRHDRAHCSPSGVVQFGVLRKLQLLQLLVLLQRMRLLLRSTKSSEITALW